MDANSIFTIGTIILNVVAVWAGTVTYHNERMTWPDAVRFCQRSGGELVKDINSIEIPQRHEKAWVGRRIESDYNLIVSNGCFEIPPDAELTIVPIRNGSFVECLEGCRNYTFIGVEKGDYYCLTASKITIMRRAFYCDFIRIGICPWSILPELSCGGTGRMSTYRFTTQGFSLPLNYINRRNEMLCAKWKRGDGRGLTLTGCQQELPVVCENEVSMRPMNWTKASMKCYANRTDLPTCSQDSFTCMENISRITGRDEFWTRGFGFDIVEYASSSLHIKSSSLCGTFRKTEESVTYVPCEEKRPFICEHSTVNVTLIIGLIAGLICVTTVFVMGILFVKRAQRSRKLDILNALNYQKVENSSNVDFVNNEYIPNEESQTDTARIDSDRHRNTNCDEIGRIDTGNANNNSSRDDHVKNVVTSSNSHHDNYSHMKITRSKDNNDHMTKASSSAQVNDDNYDHMIVASSSAQVNDDNYNHMIVASSSAQVIDDDNYDHMIVASSSAQVIDDDNYNHMIVASSSAQVIDDDNYDHI
ncbi:uncharacterized protein LOC132555645 [Ylistrum balloti]|uniref:uncharacterized protein LOC132555645 n=1 Tax=Ylistrum balloti TaxID=509963 RepID=UPI002905B879|nr:uncharacterized protein LOC132555645 [Ylistrum balloti]